MAKHSQQYLSKNTETQMLCSPCGNRISCWVNAKWAVYLADIISSIRSDFCEMYHGWYNKHWIMIPLLNLSNSNIRMFLMDSSQYTMVSTYHIYINLIGTSVREGLISTAYHTAGQGIRCLTLASNCRMRWCILYNAVAV